MVSDVGLIGLVGLVDLNIFVGSAADNFFVVVGDERVSCARVGCDGWRWSSSCLSVILVDGGEGVVACGDGRDVIGGRDAIGRDAIGRDTTVVMVTTHGWLRCCCDEGDTPATFLPEE